jgi:hypothetical protein
LLFIDFQQAFDSLAHNAICQALKEKGVPQKVVTIIQAIYDMQCFAQKPGVRTYSCVEWSKTGLYSRNPAV